MHRFVVVLVVALAACSKPSEAPESAGAGSGSSARKPSKVDDLAGPERVAREYFTAFAAGDMAAIHALYITPAMFDEYSDCSKGQDQHQVLSDELATADRLAAERKASGATLTVGAWMEGGRKTTPVGAELAGCTIKKTFEVVYGTLDYEDTPSGGSVVAKSGSFIILRTDDTWHLVHVAPN